MRRDHGVRSSTAKSWNILYEEQEAIVRGWSRLLHPELALPHIFNEEASNFMWPSDGPTLIKSLAEAQGVKVRWYKGIGALPVSADVPDPENLELLGSIAGESTYRCLFNSQLAWALRLSYAPSSLRVPYRHFLRSRSECVADQLALTEFLRDEYAASVQSYRMPREADLEMPLFLTALLAEISQPNEFFEALANLRLRAAPLRARRAALTSALKHGNAREIDALREAIKGEAKSITTWLPASAVAGAAAAILPLLSEANTSTMLFGVGLLTFASQYPIDQVRQFAARAAQPHIEFVRNTAHVARGLTNVYGQAASLWKLPEHWAAHTRRRLERLSVASAA